MEEKKSVATSVKSEELIQKRRKQLIKAAVKLITEKGFHKMTTREIAKACGFSIGTLYEYIRSKEDVLYLVCDYIYEQVSTRLKENVDLTGDGLQCLRDAIATFVAVVNDMQDEILIMYQEVKSLTRDALPYVLNKELEMAAIFEDILKFCISSGQLKLTDKEIKLYAHHILVQCQMWAFRRWAFKKDYSITEFQDMQIKVLLFGLSHIEKHPFSIEGEKNNHVGSTGL
ncbi:AcrR family transcriptional regulator [Scopulibacillus daqui]|uniref:AcrR family transcriptional regulator n=1 Tax=Scopulibacillus daqui TaxID=1469162 RepID=A0ABS2PZD7_9BACL|nr:TetR/AcrR family transcriptional regulator [Scopulibacillus daqui]MBM7645392.1 AcrR family transcriptional regulator [Scopulibacillus daqui]